MVLAGGNGPGSGLHQLKIPRGVAVDVDGAVVVADSQNHRVVRWTYGADVGELVARGLGLGSSNSIAGDGRSLSTLEQFIISTPQARTGGNYYAPGS